MEFQETSTKISSTVRDDSPKKLQENETSEPDSSKSPLMKYKALKAPDFKTFKAMPSNLKPPQKPGIHSYDS